MTGAILVAGAADALGRALSAEFCARGHRVAGLGASAADVEAVGAGPLFIGVPCDAADPAAVRVAFRDVRARIGPVAVLVNNVAPQPRRDVLDETADSIMAAVHSGLGSLVACTREALVDMTAEGTGRILNVAGADRAPAIPASATFAVLNEAGRAFTRALVADLSDRFPRIVTIDWIPSATAVPANAFGDVDPKQAAQWAVTLALMQEPRLNGTTWQGNRELLPPRALGRRVVDRVLGRSFRGRLVP